MSFECKKCETVTRYSDRDKCECYEKNRILKEAHYLWQQSELPMGLMIKNPLSIYKPFNLGDNELTLEYIDAFVDRGIEINKNWLYIQGPVGSGKTFLSVIVAQLALLKSIPVYFITVADLLDKLRPKDIKEEKEANIMDIVMNCPLLILDDIGQEKSSEWVRERLFIIINNRYNEGLKTIFTSNRSIEDMSNLTTPQIYDRMRHKSIVFDLSNESNKRVEDL